MPRNKNDRRRPGAFSCASCHTPKRLWDGRLENRCRSIRQRCDAQFPEDIEIIVVNVGAGAGQKRREYRYVTLVLEILVATTFVSES